MSIPASEIVAVTPSVISGGGTGLDMIGLIVTEHALMPVQTMLSFPDAASVANFFGSAAEEAIMAGNYFLGFDDSNIKPDHLLFFLHQSAPLSAFVQGGPLPGGNTLANLQSISGTLVVVLDGVTHTAATLNFAGVASFTAAATLIETSCAPVLTTGTCTWNATLNTFHLKSPTTGVASSVAMPSGTAADRLGLDAARGAYLSQGAIAQTPQGTMGLVLQASSNWVSFTTAWDPDPVPSTPLNKEGFASWTNLQNNRFLYVPWDKDATPINTANAAGSFGMWLKAGNYSGTAPISSTLLEFKLSAFLMGAIASIDFTELNGRASLAFKSQTGLTPDTTTAIAASNLLSNGYNFYGEYATAADKFLFLNPGYVSGPFKWIDSYINQIWLNNAFQLALMELLTTAKSIPYNQPGYDLIAAALRDPIVAAVNFGSVVAGVQMSAQQAALVNGAAGVKIDNVLFAQGWYLQILPATAQVRANRGSPPVTFWYMDGESVQQINMASVAIL